MGVARLERALAAYREALQECTRERVPLDWAITQYNLGTALCRVGGTRERDGPAVESAMCHRVGHCTPCSMQYDPRLETDLLLRGSKHFQVLRERTMRLTHPLRQLLSGSVLAAILFSQQVVSQSQSPSSAGPTATTSAKPDPSKANCTNNGTYVNSKGQTVKRPENCSIAPKGATAQCRDGTYSFSQSRRGTCSHHGGVAKWL